MIASTPSSFSIRNILLITISMLTLLIILLVGNEVFVQWRRLENVESLMRATILGDDLFDAGQKVSIERHISYSMLHTPQRTALTDMRTKLQNSRRETDAAFNKLLPSLDAYGFSNQKPRIQALAGSFQAMQAMRGEVDRALEQPIKQRNPEISSRWFRETTGLIMQAQDIWRKIINDFTDVDSIVNAQMRFKYFLWVATEYTGRERSLIGRLIVENAAASPREQAQLLRWQGIVDYFWSTVHMVADQSRMGFLDPYLKDAKSDYDNVYDMIQDIFLVPSATQKTPYPINGDAWLELSTQANSSLYLLKDVALKETRHYVQDIETRARSQIMFQSLALLLTLLLCAYSFQVVLIRVLRPINTMIEALVGATLGRPAAPALMEVRQEDEVGKLAHVLSVFQKNVDELKRSTVMLARYNEELKRSNQELDDFAYIASHDLKEPLRGLVTQTSFLLEDYQDKLDAEAIRRLRRLIYLSQRMEQLISDLLYFSRLGRTELAIQEVDLNDIVGEVRQMMDTFLKEHNAKVVIPKPMPRTVCDKLRVAEVFRNLITNAVKYNDKPEPVVEVGYRDSVSTPQGEERNVFYVKDNGVGIEAGFYEAIFRIFKRLKNPAVKNEEGTGSGLTFVKKIVERHKGRIWLESEPGRGSIFYFTLGGKNT